MIDGPIELIDEAAPTQNDKESSNGVETAKLAGSDRAFWIGLILAAFLFAIMLSRPG